MNQKGCGITPRHYTGTEAEHIEATFVYSVRLVVSSAVLATVISFLASQLSSPSVSKTTARRKVATIP
ncbi:MAG: hypothetical protein HIU91_08025 [Acidobacteria bacterium]|nr:hypothetical protein [Acidobacteriota bacterium]